MSRRGRPPTPVSDAAARQRMAQMYRAGGVGIREIALEVGYSRDSVRLTLRDMGVPLRARGQPRHRNAGEVEQERATVHALVRQGKSPTAIKAQLGATYSVVHKHLRELGLKVVWSGGDRAVYGPRSRPETPPPQPLTAQQLQQALALHRHGIGYLHIATMMGVDDDVMHRALTDAGEQIRPRPRGRRSASASWEARP